MARARARWRAAQPALDPQKLVFIDETGSATDMAPLRGRCRRGERLIGRVPHGHWKTTTFVAGLRREEITAPFVVDRPMNGVIFKAYVEQVLAPTLTPGDVVIMDNLSCHKTAEAARLIAAAGAELRFLPAYSPDLNPIERMFSKLKAWLRSAKARTIDALVEAMGDALRTVRPGDLVGWFRHSGYQAPKSSDTLNRKLL